jgi:hypothetical protein
MFPISRDVVHMGSDVSPKGRSRRKRREAAGARGEVGRLVEGSVSAGVWGRAGALITLVGVVEEGPAEFDGSFSEPGVRSG